MEFLVEDLYNLLVGRTSTAIGRRLLRNFRAHGLDISQEQWAVLVELWREDGQIQQELAVKTYKDKPSITRLIDKLEAQGLVERRADETDRRIKRIFLTEKGKALEKDAMDMAQKTLNEAISGIEAEKILICREVLYRVYKNLAQDE
ncbi:DNA-binding MarR family transcriptional regulator [Thermonema lapsum]|uniref:DNA-binding MarR family transcriptional regulator n=1 Tax=Thermonema lapsum TaxID=28195 RepID=A0A846MSZ2_9BACT|nr:MarR family transcriptional regulator [Thermonema lapsum]NIK74754.1 DNA-binding MarR family transcriptional regulator [Thermonema lapsum]